MRKVLFLTTLFAFVLTSSVWAADISGTWTVKAKDPAGGDDSFDLIIKDAGGNLTITGTHPILKALVGTGTVNGDVITMNVKSGEAPVQFAFTGKVAGNKMSGNREIITSHPKPGTKEFEKMEAASAGKKAAAGMPMAPPPLPTGPVSKDFTAEMK